MLFFFSSAMQILEQGVPISSLLTRTSHTPTHSSLITSKRRRKVPLRFQRGSAGSFQFFQVKKKQKQKKPPGAKIITRRICPPITILRVCFLPLFTRHFLHSALLQCCAILLLFILEDRVNNLLDKNSQQDVSATPSFFLFYPSLYA